MPLLKLGLGGLESRHQKIAHLVGGLIEVEAHPVASETLGQVVDVVAVWVWTVFV
jgi:hypothetical protein